MGALSFGGPPVQVAMLRDLTVERRRWLDAREFEDANAAVQLIPGPAGTQLAIYCAMRVGGTAGAIFGGLAFILPGLLLILAISALALADSPPEWILGIGAGAAAAVVAVVAQAGIVLTRSSLRHRRAILYVIAGAVATVFAGAGLVLALLACGLVELAWRRRPGAMVHAWPVALLLAATGAAALPALAWTALKVGALSYGGGFVIIPLMHQDAVDTYGWMTSAEFANAVAYGQLTPGPVVQTVAIVGWAAAGLGGALLASVVAFAPSFLVVGLTAERFERLRRSGAARAFLPRHWCSCSAARRSGRWPAGRSPASPQPWADAVRTTPLTGAGCGCGPSSSAAPAASVTAIAHRAKPASNAASASSGAGVPITATSRATPSTAPSWRAVVASAMPVAKRAAGRPAAVAPIRVGRPRPMPTPATSW
jgi:chromate transporter